MKYCQYGIYCFCLFFSGFLCAQSEGGYTSGAAAYCDTLNSGFISLNSFNGAVLFWEQSTDGQSWQQIQNTTSTQSYNKLQVTTSFRAIVQDGSFPPDTSTVATITVHVPGIAGTVSGGGTFCSGANNIILVLNGTEGNVLSWQAKDPGGQWTTINNTTYTLQFTDHTQAADYRAVVQRVVGCVADTSAKTTINLDAPSLSGSIAGSDSLCYGSPGDTLVLTGQRGTELQWLTSVDDAVTWVPAQSTVPFYIYPVVKSTAWYAVSVKNGVCPTDTTAPAIVMSYPEVIADAGPDATIMRRESVQINGRAVNGVFRWNPSTALSDSASISPTATPRKTITYELIVLAESGCIARDSVKITVEIPIPTAITPNGDGVNDQFEIYEVEKFPKCVLDIYDRWGNLVYHASPYENKWDGTSADHVQLPESTYYYAFDYGVGEKPVTGYVLIKR